MGGWAHFIHCKVAKNFCFYNARVVHKWNKTKHYVPFARIFRQL